MSECKYSAEDIAFANQAMIISIIQSLDETTRNSLFKNIREKLNMKPISELDSRRREIIKMIIEEIEF